MVKRDLIRNIIIAVLAIVVILLLRAFVFSTHRVTEGQANDYIHAVIMLLSIKMLNLRKKILFFIQLMARNILVVLLLMKARA